MIIQSNLHLAKNISAPTVSKIYANHTGDTLSLQISGNFTSGVFHIEGRAHPAGAWVSLAGINLSDFSVSRGGFTQSGLYEIGIAGVREIRSNIEAINGTVTLFGQILSMEET